MAELVKDRPRRAGGRARDGRLDEDARDPPRRGDHRAAALRRSSRSSSARPRASGSSASGPSCRATTSTTTALRTLPATTLGGAYVRHLDRNHITADYQAAATRHVDDPDIAYLMRRFRQTHDVWHALLGLGIAGHEEVIIHWFTYGQLRLPVSALIMVFGTLKHLVLERRWRALRHSLLEAYRDGRDARRCSA